MASPAQLTDLRDRIDSVDASLIQLLAERFSLTEQVGQIKAESRLPAEDAERERSQQARYACLAATNHLRVDVALRIMGTIVELVKDRHAAIAAIAAPRGH